jgi:hypothetical protein
LNCEFSEETIFEIAERKIKKVRKTTPKIEEEWKCPKDGYYPDRTDCTKYIMCNGGQPTINTCTEGLVWDAEQRFCSWPDQVECKNGKRPWTEMTDNKGGTIFI